MWKRIRKHAAQGTMSLLQFLALAFLALPIYESRELGKSSGEQSEMQ